MKKSIKVEGICCAGCIGKIERALGGLEETESVSVDSSQGLISLELSNDVDNGKITDIITNSGHYTVVEIS